MRMRIRIVVLLLIGMVGEISLSTIMKDRTLSYTEAFQ